MNVKAIAQYIQWKMHGDLTAVARDEAVTATAAAIGRARAEANSEGKDPDAAEAAVEAVRPRRVDDEVPTLEWCGRMALKHARSARDKTGKLSGLREELLDRVKKDPDTVGRKPPASPGGGPG